MNVSTIEPNMADRYMAKVKSSSQYRLIEGIGCAKVYRITDGKLVVELDWDEDTDVIVTTYNVWPLEKTL